jgi:hypothetical protein
MAKIRRIIRKLQPVAQTPVEEQLWPVYVSLLLFGGLLAGVVLAYMRFDDPRWYFNALLWLLLVPVFIGASMVALYFVNTRVMRRGIQLALVLSILFHCICALWLAHQHIFGEIADKPDKGKSLTPEREAIRIVVEEVVERPREQRDFERPVETPEPETKPEEVDRSQPEPEPIEQPEIAKPEPKVEPKPQVTPQVAQRAAAGETAPRFSETASKLSRQVSKAAPTTNRSADAPQVAVAANDSTVKPEVAVAKTTPQTNAMAKPVEQTPQTIKPQTDTQVARRDPTEQQPETSTTPNLPKQNTQATQAPSTALAQVATPSATKATDPAEVQPQTVSPEKVATASPEIEKATEQPTPQTPQEVSPTVQARATQAEAQPTLAQAQESVPNPRPRETTRPSVSTLAATAATAETPQQSPSTEPSPTPNATSIAKAETRNQPTDAATPTETPSVTPAAVATTETTKAATPGATPQPTAVAAVTTPNRTATKAGVAQSAQVDVAQPSTTAESSSGEVSPTSVAVRKQATESPQSASTAGAPTAAQVSGSASTSPAALAARRENAENAPTNAQQQPAAAMGRSDSQVALNARSTAEAATSSVGAQTVADATNVGPSSAQVARQEQSSPGATASRQPLPSETLASSTQVASAGAQKAAVASQPSLNPSARPTASPARSLNTAQLATSPTEVESPSLATSSTGQGDPTAQPTRMALTKSLAGTAGVGQSPNLDRSLPAADSPALVASGSARREQATQDMPEGPALAPSATALAGRSQSTANTPTSTLKAEALDNASQAGAETLARVEASAGAALTRQSSDAPQAKATASVGQVEVDVGPTQVVADSGASSRASGGGQPTINTQTQSRQIARNNAGSSAAASLAASTKAEAVAAPPGIGGGAPKSLDVNIEATAIARTQAGGEGAVSGGPATAAERGPATAVSAASLVGDTALAKRDNSAPGGAPQAAGQPDVPSSSEAARTVARASGGAPQLAVGGPTVADVANIPQGDGGAPAGGAQPTATSVAKAATGGGAPSGAARTTDIAAASTGGIVSAVQVGRAEATEAMAGAPAAGGGQAAQPRRSTGPAFAANAKADLPTLAGSPASGGAAQGTPVAATGAEVAKLGGSSGVGGGAAVASAPSAEPTAVGGTGTAGVALAQRSSGSESGEAPAAVANVGAGSPGRRSANVALSGGPSATADVIAGAAVAQASGENPLAGMDRGALSRQEITGAIPVNVAAAEGPGGLGAEVAVDVGINSRRASTESLDVQIKDARFTRQKVGGELDVNTSAIVATEGFRKRGPDGRGGPGSAAPQTEESVELGLVYLQRKQLPDGSWSLQGHGDPAGEMLASDTAATALAVLAFQGAGYSHREHRYQDVVRGGLMYLIQNQAKNGDLFVKTDDRSNSSAWLYSHALATLALCEAYGMTGDPELREPAQKAIDFIVASQNKERGGWRYTPQAGSDTSVTGWMMMALKSGELANLDVPVETYHKIRQWLDVSDGGDGRGYMFRYDPWAPDTREQRHGRAVSKTMTSVGLLMRLYLGWKKDNPSLLRGGDYLLANPPEVGTVRPKYITETPRDTYYWYYATQVMWHLGGEYRERWLAELHPLLLKSQVQNGAMAGSWDPAGTVPDRWGPTAGRLYVTTMNLLSLEVRYRYLPIYDSEQGNIGP